MFNSLESLMVNEAKFDIKHTFSIFLLLCCCNILTQYSSFRIKMFKILFFKYICVLLHSKIKDNNCTFEVINKDKDICNNNDPHRLSYKNCIEIIIK